MPMVICKITSDIAQMWRNVQPGKDLTYLNVDTRLGIDSRKHRQQYYKAFKIVTDESGADFVNKRGIGYTKRTGEQTPAVLAGALKSAYTVVGRGARRTNKILGKLNDNEISQDTRRQCAGLLSRAGVIRHAADLKTSLPWPETRIRPASWAATMTAFVDAKKKPDAV